MNYDISDPVKLKADIWISSIFDLLQSLAWETNPFKKERKNRVQKRYT